MSVIVVSHFLDERKSLWLGNATSVCAISSVASSVLMGTSSLLIFNTYGLCTELSVLFLMSILKAGIVKIGHPLSLAVFYCGVSCQHTMYC